MQALLTKLQADFPQLTFTAGDEFCWSPEQNEVVYKAAARGPKARWSLLHETGHALLEHKNYTADFHLLKLEIQAWEKAQELAAAYGVVISEEHVQDCLDTYRDWLYKRSICPNCSTKCLQQNDIAHYRCFNCHTTWRVSSSRFCRAYRSTKNVTQSTGLTPEAVFQLKR